MTGETMYKKSRGFLNENYISGVFMCFKNSVSKYFVLANIMSIN